MSNLLFVEDIYQTFEREKNKKYFPSKDRVFLSREKDEGRFPFASKHLECNFIYVVKICKKIVKSGIVKFFTLTYIVPTFRRMFLLLRQELFFRYNTLNR